MEIFIELSSALFHLGKYYTYLGFGVGYERYTQTQRLEQCMYPGMSCEIVNLHDMTVLYFANERNVRL